MYAPRDAVDLLMASAVSSPRRRRQVYVPGGAGSTGLAGVLAGGDVLAVIAAEQEAEAASCAVPNQRTRAARGKSGRWGSAQIAHNVLQHVCQPA